MKVPMIIAIILIVLGLLLALSSLLMVRFDFRLFSSTQYEQKEQTVTDHFSDIVIKADTHDIKILPATDDSVRVVYDEPQHKKITVAIGVQDGKLTITEQDTRKWYEKISIFNFGKHKITVYLPQGAYGTLDLTLSTGDIAAEKGLTFAAAHIAHSTGDLTFYADVTGEMNITVSTGDTRLGGSLGSLKLVGSTGDVVLSDLTVLGKMEMTLSTGDVDIARTSADEIVLKVSTGDIEAESVTVAGNMTVTSSTGEIELDSTVIGGNLEIKSSTGDISLYHSDAATIRINSDTGDVSGKFLTDKSFFAQSDTGRVRVPKTSGGLCEITTNTGNIDFLSED